MEKRIKEQRSSRSVCAARGDMTGSMYIRERGNKWECREIAGAQVGDINEI